MSTARILLVACCVLLAGCTSQSLSPGPTAGPPIVPRTDASGNLTANDCASMVARAYYPLDTGPGERPVGWNRSKGVASELEMNLYDCRRVAVAGLERPVALMFEVHGNVEAPDGCREGDWNVYRVLHAVWTNDTAVAASLERAWEVPVRAASFERGTDAATETWTWEHGRLGATAAALGGDETGTRLRFAWPTAHGVSLLDIHERSLAPQYQVPLVVGQVSPPLLAAERSEQFVGEGGRSSRSTLEARLSKFGDALCESPLPS